MNTCGSAFIAFVLGWFLNALILSVIAGVLIVPNWLYRRRQRRKVH